MSAVPPGSIRRASATLGVAIAVNNLAQVGWIAVGRHAFPNNRFGVVLAAQGLYGVLQIVLDNGASLEGARLAAAGTLTAEKRAALFRARVVLAGLCMAVTLAIGAFANGRFLVASLPFLAALLLFALLNWWEPVGHGDMRPFAAYTAGRSLGLAGLVVPAAAVGLHLPIVIPGCVECAVIVLVMVGGRQPMPSLRVRGAHARVPWEGIARIGAPAVIAQYDYAFGTVLLGATTRAAAAAVVGVSLRLVSGLGGVNGVLSTVIFSRLARSRSWRKVDAAVAAVSLVAIVLISAAGLAVVIVLAPVIASGFLGHDDAATRATLVVGFSAGTAVGATAQLSMILVAVHEERRILRASAFGALMLGGATLSSLLFSLRHSSVVVAAAFAGGEAVTAVMLARVARRETDCPPRALGLVGACAVVLPAVAGLESLVPAVTFPLVGALVAFAMALARKTYVYARTNAGGGPGDQTADEAAVTAELAAAAELGPLRP